MEEEIVTPKTVIEPIGRNILKSASKMRRRKKFIRMNPQRQCCFLRLHAICLCVTNDTHWAFEVLPMETETEGQNERAG